MLSLVLFATLSASPQVAVLSVEQGHGALRFQGADAVLAEPVARVELAEGSPLLGSLLPGTRTVIATGVVQPRGDLSFGSALFRLEAGKPTTQLIDRVVYGSRPLISSEGRVFVSRGKMGPALTGAMRVDALTIEEINPATGVNRVVLSTSGWAAFLAGSVGRELVIYEIAPSGARLLLVHVDTLAQRSLITVEPSAHDFVVDARRNRVLFTQRDGDGFRVDAVSLGDGASSTLARGTEVTLLPAVLADGRVLISGGAGKGLQTPEGAVIIPAQGEGFERLISDRVVLHERPSEASSIHLLTGARSQKLPTPSGVLDVAGVLP